MTEQIDYDPNTVLEALNNKADRDLNNVTDGTYQVLTTKNVTNCITKIPQDIKLELNNDTLTLKAGSKLYDGSGNVISIAKDYTVDTSSGNGVVGVFYSKTQDKVWANQLVSTATSGETPPTGSGMFYNTVTKSVDFYKNGVLDESDWSLPLAIITVNEGTSTSIDQIFNGFGYIGSTIFALPGVEGLIPNGRNEDGSLNNKSFKTTSMLTANALFNANLASIVVNSTFLTMVTDNNVRYDNNNNFNFLVNNNDKYFAAFVGTVSIKDLKIASFNPKTTLRILDRNDKEEIISWGMPDYDAGIDITAYDAVSHQFVAPCDGVLIFTLSLISNGVRIYIDDVLLAMPSAAGSATVGTTYSFVISKGQKFYVSPGSFYTLYGINAFFPFKGVN